MTQEDPIARLIPWYATGTLEPSESAKVEAHLSTCDGCRDLLALARGFRRLAPQNPSESFFDHVQSQQLVDFAADPASLEPDARRFITTHIQACGVCAEALEILEDLGRDSIADDRAGTPEAARPVQPGFRHAWRELWRRLSRTLLHPAPALVYLTALVVLLAVLPLRVPGRGTVAPTPDTSPPQVPPPHPSRPSTVMVIPPLFDLPGEVQFRGDERPPPLASIPFRAGATGVALELVTDADPEDLKDPEAAFRVEILQGDRLVLDERRLAADFDRRGRLLLFLESGAVAAGVPCQVRVLLKKPGDPRDGEELYRRSFVLAKESAGPR